MADAAETSRGMQFARDMKEIRRSNGISIEDIHEESKIPVGLIESFEESGLFDHTMFNRVYLRSFVRTYADVVGISADRALSSLEAALEGTYQRELAVEYLGLEPEPEPAPAPEAAADEDTIIPEPEPEPSHAEEPPVVRAPARRAMPTPPVAPREPSVPEPPMLAEDEPAPFAAAEEPWTSKSPPPGSPIAPKRPQQVRSRSWGYVVIAAIALVAVVWAITRITGEADSPSGEEVVAATDTSTAATEGETGEAPLPVSLGDTMHVTIASADSQLVQDIKVTVDDDLRRPYWLEAGESRTFRPQNQIIIERELDVIDLLVEGRPYPTSRVDDQGRIVITRDTALQFLRESR